MSAFVLETVSMFSALNLVRSLRIGAMAVLVAAAGLAPAVTEPAWAQGGPARVETDIVRMEPLQQTVAVLGRMVPRQSGVVAVRVAERVADIPVQVGDRVARGDALAELAKDRLESEQALQAASVTAAEGHVRTDRALLAKARQTLSRQLDLEGSTAFRRDRTDDARRDVDAAAAELASTEADLARARAQLALAEIALEDATIRAPFSGVVTVKHAVEGSYVRIGDPIVTLLNDEELEIEADVPANRTSGLITGSVIEADLQVGGRIFAVVRAVVPEENPRTRTRAVRFVPQLPDPDTELVSNQSVTVHVPIGAQRQVLTVPKDAVIVQGSNNMAFVVIDGAVQPRQVQLGESAGDRFEVLSGLAEGDEVVTRGNERLRPGQPVQVAGGGQG